MTDTKVVTYKTDSGQEIELSIEIVRKYLLKEESNLATDKEIYNFIALCLYQKLNPFLNEAYLIKTGTRPASIVIGKDVFTKRASQDERCLGWEAGVIVKKDVELIYRTGSFTSPEETLLGGWATCYRDGWEKPVSVSVSLGEYQRLSFDNAGKSNWETMPGTMIRKVALVQSLREALPDKFQGMYSYEEMPPLPQNLDSAPEKPKANRKPDVKLEKEYLNTATKYGLSKQEAIKLAESIGKTNWDKLKDKTFKLLTKRFETDGKKAADDAKVWLETQNSE